MRSRLLSFMSTFTSKTITTLAQSQMKSKILLAFDFDHTMIEDNSDTHVQKLSPGGKIPDSMKDKYDPDGWTEWMGTIFRYLHQHGTTPQHMLANMAQIPWVAGMENLLQNLNLERYEVIIISDSNSVFIKHCLESAKLSHVVSETYTNPAYFDESGCLNIEFYHNQDWCDLSTINLCKGHILEAHIAEAKTKGIEYSTVGYIGDGSNDLCPSLKLRSQDVCYPRKGWSLVKKIAALAEGQLSARTDEWTDGLDLAQKIALIPLPENNH